MLPYHDYVKWPPLPRNVFWGQIIPHLKALNWEIGDGRGLEVDQRVYKPGWKAKWRTAKRGQDYFLTYDEEQGHPDEELISYVVENGIIPRDSIWPTNKVVEDKSAAESESTGDSGELSSSPSVEATTAVGLNLESSNADVERPRAKHKRKLLSTKRSNRVNNWHAGHSREKRASKQQKISVNENSPKTSSKTSSDEVVELNVEPDTLPAKTADDNRRQMLQAGEFGLKMLEHVEHHLSDFVTLMNRRWETLKEVDRHGTPPPVNSLVSAIGASLQDLKGEIDRMAVRVNDCAVFSTPVVMRKLKARRFQCDKGGVKVLLSKVKLYMQQLVATIRQHRRALPATCSTGRNAMDTLHGTSQPPLITECKRVTWNISVLLSDLVGAINEMAATSRERGG